MGFETPAPDSKIISERDGRFYFTIFVGGKKIDDRGPFPSREAADRAATQLMNHLRQASS